jgi:hypothetical protein
MMTESNELTCSFCSKTIGGVGAAIDAGWSPSFYLDAVSTSETGTPVCPDCEMAHLDADEDGELVLKPGHAGFLARRAPNG